MAADGSSTGGRSGSSTGRRSGSSSSRQIQRSFGAFGANPGWAQLVGHTTNQFSALLRGYVGLSDQPTQQPAAVSKLTSAAWRRAQSGSNATLTRWLVTRPTNRLHCCAGMLVSQTNLHSNQRQSAHRHQRHGVRVRLGSNVTVKRVHIRVVLHQIQTPQRPGPWAASHSTRQPWWDAWSWWFYH